MRTAIMEFIFIESGEFTRRITKLKLEDELRELQFMLLNNPKAGDLDPGACGLRKVRMRDRRRGQGKSFGARVHYLYLPHRSTIYLLNVYPKDEQDALTPEQKKLLCARIRELKAE
jgi:hypothetical protein